MTPQETGEVLSQPFVINGLQLRNRIVMGPMAANAPTVEGGPSEQTIAFYEARARGGVGMIIAGGIVATKRSYAEAPGKTSLRFEVDTFVPDLRRVAHAVHAHGVPIIAEIMPGFGVMGKPGPGRPTISASPGKVVIPEGRFPQGMLVPGGIVTGIPDEATIAEIETYEREMIQSAVHAHQAGWDGVEVAAHMSYFAASFLSARTNWRTDHYGGPVENRGRMMSNIVTGIRERLGRDFIVGLRMVADDYMPDGQGAAGFADVAGNIVAHGVDYVALVPGCYETMDRNATAKDGILVDDGVARVFRDTLSVPLIIQGQHDPANGAAAIAGGLADLVSVARPVLADAAYAAKVTSGHSGEIVRCDRDNLCVRRMVFGMPVRCSVNPHMGRESRKPGSLPPLSRVVQAPVEAVVLGLTGSKALMGLASKLAKYKS
jgi:dimethylglycine catabolism A